MGENKRRSYVQPRMVDLMGYSAKGETEGSCATGPYPYFTCISGPGYIATCTGGTGVDVSTCGGGYVHYDPACKIGSDATTRCRSGAHQNF